MILPEKLLDSLVGLEGFDRKAFVAVHLSGEQITSVRLNPAKTIGHSDSGLNICSPVPWSSFGYYLDKRPSFTFDPLFHAGTYYVQEASSMFLEQALKQTLDLSRSQKILDLCAAPGGKSTLIQSLITQDSLLISNEVIKARISSLKENLTKWGAANVIFTNNDPKDMGRLENYFDVVVVDAPCSGSGLFRREPDLAYSWSEDHVHHCSLRQRRILANVWPSLKENGILIYSTCSYSREENEVIVNWMVQEAGFESLRLNLISNQGIVETITGEKNIYGYRFYPDKLKGEGFFIACLRKTAGADFRLPRFKTPSLSKLSKNQEKLARNYLKKEISLVFFVHDGLVNALPSALEMELTHLQSVLYIKKAGVLLGKLTEKEMIPDHELALSSLIGPDLPFASVNLEEAIKYLQKKEMRLDCLSNGWVVIQYKGQNLGWVKIMKNRINNYYPKDWRIQKN